MSKNAKLRNRIFEFDLIKKTLTSMMVNELYIKNDGGLVDRNYIDGFIVRLYRNMEEDEKRAKEAAIVPPSQDIIDAWNAGKRIQVRLLCGSDRKWYDLLTKDECPNIYWRANEKEYRVKPE